ncbi:MAG TPA: uracil phosphoribosyltransferase [Bacteroidota bacterium]|nr:uracil phosphoribosyltransferase [Bacteroidota bacterium]
MKKRNLVVIDHPLVQHKMTHLRDKDTGSKDFRELVSEITLLVGYEATRNMKLRNVKVKTPLAVTKAKVVAGDHVCLVSIFRAGLGMVESMLQLMPTAKVGHIGLYRDHDSLKPVQYYCKLPEKIATASDVFILDPMLATGGSASDAVKILKKAGAKNIKLLCLVACNEGIDNVLADHPDVQIFAAVVDPKLNNVGYIVPGLGDAGDRLYGTK